MPTGAHFCRAVVHLLVAEIADVIVVMVCFPASSGESQDQRTEALTVTLEEEGLGMWGLVLRPPSAPHHLPEIAVITPGGPADRSVMKFAFYLSYYY